MAADVTVKLGFRAGPAPDEATEGDFGAWFGARPDERPALFDEEGSVYMTVDGQEARFFDQLSSLVYEVCFSVPIKMTDTDLVVFALQNYDTAGQFRRDGDEIEVASNVFNPVRFPAGPLLRALVDAGERYIELVGQLWPDDADEILPYYRTQAAEARSRVTAAFPPS